MKVSKDAASAARRIYRLCAPEGRLDEDKIRKAFEKIAEAKPRDYRAIMHSLLNLVRLYDKSRQALIESATQAEGEQARATAAQLRSSAYNDSKHALMLWLAQRAPDLARQSNVWAHASTPGMVDTQLGRHSMSPLLW